MTSDKYEIHQASEGKWIIREIASKKRLLASSYPRDRAERICNGVNRAHRCRVAREGAAV